MDIPASKQVQTYRLSAQDLRDQDLPLLHELSVSVCWPHRMHDLRLFKRFGHGLLATDPIGRVAGSALWFPMGQAEANIGFVITSPRLQAHGAGRWLMDRIIAQAGRPGYRLNATRAALDLYRAMGFRTIRTIHQRQGIVTATPEAPVPQGLQLRQGGAADLPRLVALDAAAYGLPRPGILAALLETDAPLLLEDASGDLAGFSICRRAGRGYVIGPVVAPTTAAAMALIAPHIQTHRGRFLRIDTGRPEPELLDLLDRAGIAAFDTVTEMHLGQVTPGTGPALTFGLISHPFG
ncbi:GNAT family N-acetyltransferase [Paracoccus nototheniae]|uniref:GNAT family N-acetyltransferase n=1 Tax=Paracoccus nototheniae TaxID=2489002 RepID=A0ABW4DWU6_9RHOB|nr:GNAT family N-acetyltransferase [Paracoccus nototheniae]